MPTGKEEEILTMTLKASAWMSHESYMLSTKANHVAKSDINGAGRCTSSTNPCSFLGKG